MNSALIARTLAGLLLGGAALAGRAVPAAPGAAPEAHRRALLVAISGYDKAYPTRKSLDWPPLHCELDAKGMRQVLIDKYGFKPEDVWVLTEEKATRKGILEAFRTHLIEPSRPGDVAFFLFSGHGQQVDDRAPDFDGKADLDEQQTDGKDESLVPYDYVSGKAPDAATTNIRDDHLQKLLRELAQQMRGAGGKVDGNITCVIDSCHSGTIVRGNLVAKGRAWDPRLDGPEPKPRAAAKAAPGSSVSLAAFGGAAGAPVPPGRPGVPGLSPVEGQAGSEGGGLLQPGEALADGYVMLTACQSHESAYEMFDDQERPLGGALAYSLCRALNAVPAGARVTYQDLFERVKVQIKAALPLQTPALEGRGDEEIFSGKARPQPSYPRVERYDREKGIATLGAGTLLGVNARSRYALYDALANPEEKDAKPLAEVTITDADSFRSRATVSETDRANLTLEKLLGAKARLVGQYFGDDKLRVLLNGTTHLRGTLRASSIPEAEDALELVLQEKPQSRGPGLATNNPKLALSGGPAFDASITAEAPVDPKSGARDLVLRRGDTVLARIPDDNLAGYRLRDRLMGLWRWRYLNRLGSEPGGIQGASPVQVTLRLVPVEAVVEGARVRVTGDRMDAVSVNGQMTLKGGDYMQVEVENTGSVPAYVTVLDLQPDGSIAPIFPHPQAPTLVENLLGPGKKLRVPGTFRISEPLGTDVFKVIGTAERVDFTPLLYQPEAITRGARGAREADAEAQARGVKGPIGPLARLLLNASTGRRGSDLVGVVEPEYWSAASVTLQTQAR